MKSRPDDEPRPFQNRSAPPKPATRAGRVAEWSIAPVLKTGDAQASVGSNPTPSATCPREKVLPIWLGPDFLVVFEGYAGGPEHRHGCREGQNRSLRADILRT